MARRKPRKGQTTADTSEQPPPDLWERLPAAAQHAICIAALAAVSIVFFSAIHFGGKGLVPSDTVSWRATAESVLQYERETGEYALWATNLFSGMPAFMLSYDVAVPQADVILRAARKVLWPSSHLITLFAGMYLLVFYLTRNRLAGLISALIFGLTTYMPVILAAGHNSKFITLALAPWVLLAFAHALRKPGLASSLLFAVALALNLRAGHFQISYYVLFVAALWWAAEGIAAYREDRFADFWQATGMLFVGGLLAGLMVAQPYLAQFEHKAFTIRGASPGGGEGGLAWDYAMGWSQGAAELLTLVIADAFGGSEAYWGPKTFTGGPHYLTGLAVLLAVYGSLRGSPVPSRALGVAGVLMALFSLGENFAVLNRLMFEFFPLFGAFRVPETWLVAVALVVAVLAGIGIDAIPRLERTGPLLKSKLVVGHLALVGLVAVLLLGGSAILDFEKEGEAARISQQIASSNNVPATDPRVAQATESVIAELKSERQEKFADDALRTLLFLVLAGAAFLLFRGGRIGGNALHAAVAVLLLIDLWGVDRRYLNEDRMVVSPNLERAIPRYPFDEFILDRRADADRFRVLSLEGAPSSTARPSYYHESISGYHGAKLRVYQDFLDNLFITPEGRLNTAVLRMLNTRYVVSRSPIPDATLAYTDEQTGLSVYELRDPLPRVYFVDSTVIAQAPEDAWELLNSRSFDPSRYAIVESEPGPAAASSDSLHTASAAVVDYSPRRITIEASTDRDRLLVVSEIFYPAGWYATLDGQPTEIVRVNYMLRGVVVPAGRHEVRMEFDPWGHRVGVRIAGISTALVYGLLLLLGLLRIRERYSRRETAAADPED